jgi:hypothetical protein
MAEFRLINGNRGMHKNNSKLMIPNTMAESLIPIINEQRKLFFDKRISEVKDIFDLRENEITDLWRLFLAGEHPEYTNGKILELLPEIIECNDAAIANEVSWCFHNFKWIWSLIWKEYQIENFAKLCARFVLKNEKKDVSLSRHSSAEEILISEITLAAQKIFKDFQLPKTQSEFDTIGLNSSHNIYDLDISSAKALAKLKEAYKGDFAPKMIDFLETAHSKFSLEERVRSWKQPLFIYKIIAGIVWNDWVKKRISLLIKKPPALPLLTYDCVRKPMKKGALYDKEKNQLIDINGNPITSIGRDIPLDVPSMELNTIKTIISKGNIKTLSSINAHRLLRWEVSTITKQFIEGNPDARAIRVDGGFSELANLIGAGAGKKAAEQVREIVVWQAHCIFKGHDKSLGNMLSYRISPHGYKKRSQLSLILGDMMLPHYVFELLGIARSKREARKLIPIVDIPPLIGRPADQGSQAHFQMEMMVKFRTHAREYLEFGGVYISGQEKKSLANEAGLPITILPRVMDRWTKDGDDAPAFLKIIENDRYALGSAYSVAQDFIISAGKKEKMGSIAAKKTKKTTFK